jgi:hypothetical protein
MEQQSRGAVTYPTLMFAVPQDQTFEVNDSQTLVTRSLLHEFRFTKIFSGTARQEDIYTVFMI